MLHRSASSRRRRASRSGGSSPSPAAAAAAARSRAVSPGGRRASIAVSPVEPQFTSFPRSPRHSLVPDIALESELDTGSCLDLAVPTQRSPRNSLVPESALSPRNSLVPESFNRSPRNSLVPDNFNRSPRNSLVPDNFNKSPRNSLVPDSNRSPRHSLVPGDAPYSSRNNLGADFNRSPRNSLVPDSNRSPRHSLIPADALSPDPSRSPRHSLVPSDSTIWNNTRTSPCTDEPNGTRSPRHTSPRGSVAHEPRTSPRDSVASEYPGERSPRGSIAGDGYNRSPRGSLGPDSRLSRIDQGRSPRGSLTLTFQEPPASERRYSADNQTGKPLASRSLSPYRMSLRGPQVNLGYSGSTWSDAGSRRASSSVSQLAQVSGDEQRRLCSEHSKLGSGAGGGGCVEAGLPLGVSLATYGSVAYQLKDANLEASGTCDFVCRALRIVNKTVAVTVVLVCLSTLPLLMLIMGIQFLRDCPQEPHIPVYMVVGGGLGCVKMAWVLYRQLVYRRLAPGGESSLSAGSRVASLALSVFLVAWFALGNYWILRIKWPEYSATLYEPNKWCHRTLYVFALVHLYVMYSVFTGVGVMVVTLAGCQLAGCPWLGPGRYKPVYNIAGKCYRKWVCLDSLDLD